MHHSQNDQWHLGWSLQLIWLWLKMVDYFYMVTRQAIQLGWLSQTALERHSPNFMKNLDTYPHTYDTYLSQMIGNHTDGLTSNSVALGNILLWLDFELHMHNLVILSKYFFHGQLRWQSRFIGIGGLNKIPIKFCLFVY